MFLSPSIGSSTPWVANVSLYSGCSFTLRVEVEQCLMAPIGPFYYYKQANVAARLNANISSVRKPSVGVPVASVAPKPIPDVRSRASCRMVIAVVASGSCKHRVGKKRVSHASTRR